MRPVEDQGASEAIRRGRLPELLAEVASARTREQVLLRQRGVLPDALNTARRELLHALVDYAEALESLSWPVPRGVLLDIKTRQALGGPTPGFR